MSSTTVAPVGAYTSETSEPAPDNYSQFSTQEQVSVNLIDNNLWLVDSSQLNAQTLDEPIVSLVDWTTKDQTNVSLDNLAATASPTSFSISGSSSTGNILPSTDLSGENILQLSEVTGSLQLDSATAPAGSGSSSTLSSGTTSTSTSTSSPSFSGDGSSSTSIGTPYSSGSTSTTDQQLPPDPSVPTPTPTLTPTPTPTPPTTSTTVPPSSPDPSSVPTPVPFEVSPTLGLAIAVVIWGGKQFIHRSVQAGKRIRESIT